MSESIDPQQFRHVLGHFPTGVAVVTSCDETGAPVGMTVGSFTSVSLSPPLVAFLPGKQSSTSTKVVRSGRFCVNLLGAHQESVSRYFAAVGQRKFEDLDWTLSASGFPRLNSAVAWIECAVDAVHDAGDHYIIVGRVTFLEAAGASLPLVFFQGGYGRFAPLSLAAASEPDLVEHLRLVDVARPFMEELAKRTQVECLASSAVGGEIVLLATAGTPAEGRPFSRVGQRLPLAPPLGAALVAWSKSATDEWFARAGASLSPAKRQHLETLLDRVRERGWSVGIWSESLRNLEATVDKTTLGGLTPHGSRAVRQMVEELGSEHEPADVYDSSRHYRLRNVTVPVFDGDQQVVMQLTLFGPPSDAGPAELDLYLELLTTAAKNVSGALSGASRPSRHRD
ncbi:MAG: flavin reductase [Candidatus Dormibacteraeota bacterium]|uniref:Flavin reductase n=1 Tax=Candidatus Aeolococcus gillhamiae TaxID=3127015 RepID=A0A934N6J2_9BACT|nr:flavin reductase [Candidatus Dormibacteraeota bacterium]MBJ7605203.1 flavin reductase [Candidatus Dormibacteraeota bacterium]